ncbi:hypothetical protein ACLOJK_034978 [Asimina triloba]
MLDQIANAQHLCRFIRSFGQRQQCPAGRNAIDRAAAGHEQKPISSTSPRRPSKPGRKVDAEPIDSGSNEQSPKRPNTDQTTGRDAGSHESTTPTSSSHAPLHPIHLEAISSGILGWKPHTATHAQQASKGQTVPNSNPQPRTARHRVRNKTYAKTPADDAQPRRKLNRLWVMGPVAGWVSSQRPVACHRGPYGRRTGDGALHCSLRLGGQFGRQGGEALVLARVIAGKDYTTESGVRGALSGVFIGGRSEHQATIILKYLRSNAHRWREEFEHSHYAHDGFIRALSGVVASYPELDLSSLY